MVGEERVFRSRKQLAHISFGIGGNAPSSQIEGWSAPEQGFTWSDGNQSTLVIRCKPFDGEACLAVRGRPFLSPPSLTRQRVKLSVGPVPLCEVSTTGWALIGVPIPRELFSGLDLFLRIDYPDAIRPSAFGSSDSRRLGFAWHDLEILSLPVSPSGSSTTLQNFGSLSTGHNAENLLEAWADRETSFWRGYTSSKQAARETLISYNRDYHWSALFNVSRDQVTFIPKPAPVVTSPVIYNRAQQYGRLFLAVAKDLPSSFNELVCVCVADQIMTCPDVPVFAFQRRPGEQTLLLPDIDLLEANFFEEENYVDRLLFEEKSFSAVFAGATTGGDIDETVAKNCGNPRLDAARFFSGSSSVDFRLPRVVQCTSEATEDIIRSYDFCQKPPMSWQEQFRHRFLLSIDGNGATCSRVAVALMSNSTLLKYNSEHSLFYFYALHPYEHYIPVAHHDDVYKVIRAERERPGSFSEIAKSGTKFANAILSRKSIEHYTAMLLRGYALCLVDAELW